MYVFIIITLAVIVLFQAMGLHKLNDRCKRQDHTIKVFRRGHYGLQQEMARLEAERNKAPRKARNFETRRATPAAKRKLGKA